MSYKTAYLETAFLNEVFKNTNFVPLAGVYVGLFTTSPTNDLQSGSNGSTEVSGGAYARQSVVAASWNAPTGTPSAVTNSAIITFPTASAGWGTVTGFGIFDALTTGNLLYYGTLTASKTVATGDVLQFNASAISISED